MLHLVLFPDPVWFGNGTRSYSDVLVTLETCCSHSWKRCSTSSSSSVSTEEVRTKCFSRRLMSGVGNFSYTVFFSAITISLVARRRERGRREGTRREDRGKWRGMVILRKKKFFFWSVQLSCRHETLTIYVSVIQLNQVRECRSLVIAKWSV